MRKIDRFLQYIEYKGVTENKATVDCDLSKGLLGQAKSGKSDLGNKTIEKVLNFYQDLSRVWLLTGEGEMLKSETTQNSRGDNTIQVSGTNVDLRNINQSKGGGGDAQRVKELEQRIEELTEDKRRLQEMVDKMQLQISKLLEKI